MQKILKIKAIWKSQKGLSLLKWDGCVDRYVAMDKTPVKKPKALNSELRVLHGFVRDQSHHCRVDSHLYMHVVAIQLLGKMIIKCGHH